MQRAGRAAISRAARRDSRFDRVTSGGRHEAVRNATGGEWRGLKYDFAPHEAPCR